LSEQKAVNITEYYYGSPRLFVSNSREGTR
jgi:hypothetical protein